ncbi:protein TASOR 2 [Paroedura picta]|uniref:protein TASOR 2 n=1 Tax=Paroedura picta TaxID=143630 RepID=UPI004055E0C3
MSPLNRKKNLAECKTTALYRPWKGQLFIQNQRVCDLALCSPFSGTIPAQLPAKLEAQYVVALRDLRRKLPEVAFGKNNYANDEVRSQGILFSLYEVETLNQNEQKVDQLLESLKEKDLALVRYLNERGLFILLTSSALAKEKDSVPEEFPRLQALFVISSPRPTRLTAKDLRREHKASERASQIYLLLPALRYALAEAAKDRKKEEVPPGVLVKRHVQEVSTLDKNLLPTLTPPDGPSLSFEQFLKKSDLEAVSGKCSQNSFSRLQRYLSDPQHYSLDVSLASPYPGADSRSAASSTMGDPGSSLDLRSGPVPREGSVPLTETTRPGQPAESTSLSVEGVGKPSRASERNLQRSKRKSSRLLGVGTRKKWAPLKVLCIMENSKKKKKKSKKKKPDLSSASSKMQRPPSDSGEPTLKLKNLQYPLRRKRGAEVLSAEIVQRTRHESATKPTSSSEAPGTEQKKPRLLSSRKSTEGEKGESLNRSRTVKKKCPHRDPDVAELEPPGDENVPSNERSAPRDACPPLRRDECDSHALNMLADLALSSCDSLLLANPERSGLSHSPTRDRRPPQGGKLLRKASDHEYHRVNAKLKGASLPGRSPQRSCPDPVQPDQSVDSPSSNRDRSKKKSARPHPAKPQVALPPETGDGSDPSVPSLISTEHSYASPALDPLQNQLPWTGSPSPPSSKNGVKSAKSGPLVGKVLPFRHQQNICHPPKQFQTYLPFSRSAIMAARPKEDFCKSRKVTFRDQSIQVTCQWEAEYLFSADSKYTNNSLEKTIVRAVHGPWDMSLSDDVEEMKLILHMWVALFYSKPFRSPTVRKVVEHSNPAKFVSLNSVVDPLELIDDSDGFCDSEKRSADSFSESYQTSNKVEGRACSPVEKPLSCNELSSTNCIENEAPHADPVETSSLPLKDGRVSSFASNLASLRQAFKKVLGKEVKEEFLSEPVLSLLSQDGSSLRGRGRGGSRPDVKAEAKTVNSVEVSQSNSASVLPELPETAKDAQGVTSSGSAVSAERAAAGKASSSADGCPIGSIESVCASGATWPEANSEYGKEERLPRGDSRDFPTDEDEEDVEGESVEMESIDLALSESNDADTEPRDMDLEQDPVDLSHEGCVAEETCVCDAASSGDGLTTLTPSPAASFLQQSAPEAVPASPGDREDPSGLALEPAFLNPVNSVEGSSVSQDGQPDGLAGLHPPQTVPFHRDVLDEVTEFARIEDSVESPKFPASPNQTDLVEHSGITREDKETCLADSVSLPTTEPDRRKVDLVTQRDSVGSQEDLLVSEQSQFSNPLDLNGGKETSWANSALQETDPAHRSKPDEITELLGNQEDSLVPPKCPVSPDQINVTETKSQEEVPLAELACELGQVQNSRPTGEQPVTHQSDSPLPAQNLASPKPLAPIGDSCVSWEEKRTLDVIDSAPSQKPPAHQITPELTENQESCAASAPSPVFPEPVSSDEGLCTDQEDEVTNVSDTDPLEGNHQGIQREQKTKQMSELLKDAIEDEAIQCLGVEGSEFRATWEGTMPSDQSENNGRVSAVEEKGCDQEPHQGAAAVSEEIKALLCELLDTVCSLKAESEEAPSKGESGVSWISAMALECVTPPESDEESHTTDQFTTSDSEAVGDERLEKQSAFVNQGAELQEDGQCRSSSYAGFSSHQAAGVERETLRENEAALMAMYVLSSCPDWTEGGTPSLEVKFQLAETAGSSKDHDSAMPIVHGEVGLGPASPEASVLSREGSLAGEGNVEISACALIEHPLEDSDSPLHEGTREGQNRGGLKDATDVQLASERAELSTEVLGPNTNREGESLSGDDDQELFGDPYCRNTPVSTCSTKSIDSRGVTGAIYIRDLSPEEKASTSDDWGFFGGKPRILDLGPEAKCFERPFMSQRDDRPALPPLKPDGKQGPLMDYINFSVTKKHKDKTRTFHSSKRGDSFTEESGLINSSRRICRVMDDPIQGTLDIECLRFHYKLKHILKKRRPQLSTSSSLFAKEFATQVIADPLLLRRVPEGPGLSLPPRSRSPLLITIANPSARQQTVRPSPGIGPSDDPFGPPPPLPRGSFAKAARFKRKGQERLAPFHLKKLTYNNKLKDCRGDISVIMDEFAELSRVMKLGDRQRSQQGHDPSTTSEDAPEKRCQPLPGRRTSYEHLFDDLCNTLHFRLRNVAKEACKKPYSFYLMETDDDPIFGRIKNLLKKGGHSEADPQLFCKASHLEADRLLVILRNEDIFPHVHKIPSLLRLKHFPNVTFAGVDSPEDILDHTYQELFQSGGFVVSDDQALETMTTGELKDVVKTLEQLNGQQKWRWLLHHKETKKLREDARVDPVARSKDSILRSCQGASFAEVLHYHQCDSRSASRSEYLNCLLNLQVQHISARLAVFLTEPPSASREAFESKGILVLDVNTFVATVQDLASSGRSYC